MVFHPTQNHPMGLSECHLYLNSTAHMVPLHATNLTHLPVYTFVCFHAYVREEVEEEKGKIMYQTTHDTIKINEPHWIQTLRDFRVT